jgi:FAD/FMN-containing dehydrogenase
VNFLADEGEAGVESAYVGETMTRLQGLKAKYDPTNFFHLNQNIKPAS